MLSPNIHIICGKCGCNHQFTYKITKEICDEEPFDDVDVIYIHCRNCGTSTSLDELSDSISKE